MQLIEWTPLNACIDALPSGVEIGASVNAPAGERWHHRGDCRHPSASTVKVPIMIQVYRMIDQGALRLDDMHSLAATEKSPGSGVMQHLHSGLQVSIADLLYLMMSISDNTATNILIDLAGMTNINDTMAELGMTSSILGRPMRGRLAIEGEQENLATASDYTRVMQAIVDGWAASASACEAMLSTLEKQHNGRRIGRYVPDAGGYRWGSKTGTNTGIVNDVGFAASPAGMLLIAVICRGAADEPCGEGAVAEIARSAMRVTGVLVE